jgi:hypothetical protein
LLLPRRELHSSWLLLLHCWWNSSGNSGCALQPLLFTPCLTISWSLQLLLRLLLLLQLLLQLLQDRLGLLLIMSAAIIHHQRCYC